MFDDGGGDGGKGAFAGTDVIHRGRNVTKGIGGTGDGEIVHFVVHDDAGFGDHELRAEEEVDGAGDCDGEARGVGGDYVGCSRSIGRDLAYDFLCWKE